MKKKRKIFQVIMYVMAVCYIIVSYLGLTLNDEIVGLLIREDQIFETVGAAAFLATSILFIISFVHIGKSGCYTKVPGLTKESNYTVLFILVRFYFAYGFNKSKTETC